MDIWKFLNMQDQKGIRGMKTFAKLQQGMGIWKYLNMQDPCPWDEWVCIHATLGKHLEMLKWVKSNGCPPGE